MKASDFKNIIKTAVKEAINESLRDIILEAVKSNNGSQQLVEQPIFKNQPKVNYNEEPKVNPGEIRNRFKEIIGDLAPKPINESQEHPTTLQLRGSSDTVSEGSALPVGEVGIDLIAKLMQGTT